MFYSKKQVTEQVKVVCEAFHVPIPVLQFHISTTGKCTTQRIRTRWGDFPGTTKHSRRWRQSPEDITLHELAHWVHYQKHKVTTRNHQSNFVLTLAEIVTFWYKDITKYSWKYDYKHIFPLAQALGILPK